MPVVEDGMQGVAQLYHQWLKVDASYTAWDGSGDSLKGGSLPVPNLSASNLDNTITIDSVAVDASLLVQPRPGTMPGLYIYYDDEAGQYYQYGGPVESGASPQTTAVYSYESTIEGGGGMFKPSFLGPYATLIYSNNLSGAQLWYYGSASTPYIEIKHVDGSVARFDSFVPYRWGYTPSGTLWHVTSVIDPYDNTATYSYDAAHRLKQIRFPSTYLQKFNYKPNWGWSGTADLLEITYQKENPGHANITLPARTWGLAFQGTLGTSGGGHFGKRLYRTYSAVRRVLNDPPSGAPYTWTSNPYEDGQIVCQLTYDTTARTLTEEQSVHTGTAFAETLTGSGFSTIEVLETSFYGSGSSDPGRVFTQLDPLTLEAFVCTYTTYGVRTTDLLTGATDIRAIEVTDLGGTVRRYEYDYDHGHMYRTVTTPAGGSLGKPRAAAVSGDNALIGGVASSGVEPDSITVDNIFDGSCVCQKPVEVRRISVRGGGSPKTRTTNYEYWGGTKLLKKRSEPNPVTGSGQVSWEYTYVQAKGSGHAWGAWLPSTETTPDGVFTYEYDPGSMQARANSASHGQMPGKIVRVAEDVRLVTTLTGSVTGSGFGTDVTTTTYLNLSSNPSGIGWSGANIQGQPRKIVDPDGVASAFDYSTEGWMTRSYSHNLTVYSEYTHNDYGEVTAATDNASSSPLAATTAFTLMSGVGVPSDQATTGATNGLLAKSEQYFDRFGHLGIDRRWNRSSTGSKPTNYNGSNTNARDWVEDQYHYLHNRLVATYRDRLPLDLPAGTGQFLKTELVWNSTYARLNYVINPNGSRTYYEFDGYGTQYRSYTKDPTLTYTVTGPKQFVGPFLEVTGSYQFAGGSDHLWTLMERNEAGTIVSITEPATAGPADYTTPPGGGVFSTGGARHEFTVDALGRITLTETYEGTGTSALLLASREQKYDQLGRQIWQHDDARLRAIDGSGTSTAGDSYIAWKYRAGSADQLDNVERSGIAATSYSYLSSGLMDLVTDGFGNETEYTYFSGTAFLSQVERTDDPAGTPRITRTAFGVDELGRNTEISEGASSPLVSAYAFSTLGNVDHYTDPMGREQKFLHDAMGRIVEHVRVGASSDIILNTSEFMDSGAADGRTKVTRKDDLLHKTVTHFDFAGRPFILQNPGADFGSEPTPLAPNKSMCLYAEYDEASRIKYTYAGDEGRTEYWRDGMGRVIQQQLEPLPGETEWAFAYAQWSTKDVFRRDALGRIPQVDYWGSGDYSLLWAVGKTEQDSINRVHKEDYYFFHAPGNILSLVSGYPSGSGTPFRTSLDYVDNLGSGLTQPLSLDFTHDSIGRLEEIDWDRAVGGSGSNLLAEYDWVGALRRSRTVNYNASAVQHGVSEFTYDAYSRLTQIQDDVWTSGTAPTSPLSQFDYTYDAASNLIKEEYLKVDGSAGDRFAYDAYHRLTKAWMGVDSTTMASSSDPTGFSSSAMKEQILYELDGANNRGKVESETAAGTLDTTYTPQGALPQGPSNRYDTIDASSSGPVTQVYDERGNHIFDGTFWYRYDYRNRLQEVWRIEESSSSMAMQSESTTAAGAGSTQVSRERPKFALVNRDGPPQAIRTVFSSVPNLVQRAVNESKSQAFRSKLRANIPGGVLRMDAPVRSGGMMGPQVKTATLVLTAAYIYDSYNRRTLTIPFETPEASQFHTYDGWRQAGQYYWGVQGTDLVAVPNKQFVWGSQLDELISYRRWNPSTPSWENYFVLQGGQDTAAKLVDDDGTLVEQYEYDPYGKASVYVGSSTTPAEVSSVGLPFLWKGIRLDSETDLLCMRNRYYSTTTTRFLTTDPIGAWTDLPNFGNQYAYCGNQPLTRQDHWGLASSAQPFPPLLIIPLIIVPFLSGCSKPPPPSPSGLAPGTWQEWGYNRQTSRGNCYRYAVNDMAEDGQYPGVNPGNEPGTGAGGGPWTCERAKAGVLRDGLPEAHGGVCPPGTYKILLVVADDGSDFHFYRQNDDGTWSDKSGTTTPRTGTKDPEAEAKRIKYGKICGYFCVPLSGCDIDKK